jgi:non-specific serine/threonine protein kinase
VLHLLGRVAYFDNDSPTARAYGERALAVAREVGDEWLVAWALHLLALAAQIAADYPLAGALYEESLAIRRRIGHTEGIGICLQMLGAIAYRQGEYRSALSLARAGLSAMHAVRTHWTMNSLALMSALAVALQQAERGVRLAGAADAVSEAVRLVPIPLMEEMLAEALESARGALSPEDYAAAWTAGRALTLEEAVAEGLAVEGDPPVRPPAGASPDAVVPAGLTPREIEVLRLIAAGKTSKEVAEDLVLSVYTVERHITHIYGKIGARGRAEATAFALRHGLG